MAEIDGPSIPGLGAGRLPLRDSQMELFARKVSDGMEPEEAYKEATGRVGIKAASAAVAARRWMKLCHARIEYIQDERAKTMIKAEDELKAFRERAMKTKRNRKHVDVSTFEGRKQFFQDVCDDYQFADGVDVAEAINAVKELMKIHDDFNRRVDEVSKTDPGMVMAVIARAHLICESSDGMGIIKTLGAQAVADMLREFFGLDHLSFVSITEGIECSSQSEPMKACDKEIKVAGTLPKAKIKEI